MQPPIVAPGALPQTSALATSTNRTHYKVLYSFSGGSDGSNPVAPLIYVGGTLYGETEAGGPYSCELYKGCGTVFSVTLGGVEKVLHTFGAGSDGRFPRAGLIEVRGTLYGTTFLGGSHICYASSGKYYFSCGTVFSMTKNGTEKVLHSFEGTDGANPSAGLIHVKGALYGTTGSGGGNICYSDSGFSCGTVFSVTTGGTEEVLHSFRARPDGAYPAAGLIYVGGKLYGTTFGGGRHGDGAVFTITTRGAEKVLHGFGAGSDGRGPSAGLIDVGGTLYGTTENGGAYTCGSHGAHCGTVFSIVPGGTEKVLHSFGSGSDGANPIGSLIELNGKLYGTTVNGGAYGGGTVFSITPGGKEKVRHSFGAGYDGGGPEAGMIDAGGTLYGTTVGGGTDGRGTVFALTL